MGAATPRPRTGWAGIAQARLSRPSPSRGLKPEGFARAVAVRCNPAGVAPAHPTRTPASRDTKTCQRSVDGTKRLTRRSRMSRCHHGVKISHGGTENTEVSRASAGERGRSPLPFVDATPSTRRGRVALQLIGIVGREHRGAFSCFDERLERLSCPAKRAFVSVGAAYPAGART